MADERLERVRELIKAKQYVEARNLLRRMNTPEAREMLRTIEGVIEDRSRPRSRDLKALRVNWHVRLPIILVVVVLVVTVVIAVMASVSSQQRQRDAEQQFEARITACMAEGRQRDECLVILGEQLLAELTAEVTP